MLSVLSYTTCGQEKIRVAVYVNKAALQFVGTIDGIKCTVVL